MRGSGFARLVQIMAYFATTVGRLLAIRFPFKLTGSFSNADTPATVLFQNDSLLVQIVSHSIFEYASWADHLYLT
jgi:hypothetical protein